MSLLSIIIPVYNGEKYIRETIRHIQHSTYTDLEIVIINDGSTDSSKQILEDEAKNDSRIVIYSKENAGVVSARNYGVEKARGEYICFVDQDDIVKPLMYEKMMKKIKLEKSEICMCSSGRSVNGKESSYDVWEDGCYEKEEILNKIILPILFIGYRVPIDYARGNHYPHIWTCVFKKDFWLRNKIMFRAYINFEDDFLVKVETLSLANRVSIVSYVGYIWRINLNSETYAHHYVEDIGYKQQLCYEDILSSLKNTKVNEHTISLLKKVIYCKQYVEAVHNITSSEIKKSRKEIVTYYQKNIYMRDFENVIKGRAFLLKGRIKPKVILSLLAKRCTMCSYLAELFLNAMLWISLHFQILVLLERKIKSST